MRLASSQGLGVVLLFSLIIRLTLIMQGGQLFFSDEQRYLRALSFISDARQGEFAQAGSRLVAVPDHVLFGIVAVLPAAVQSMIEQPPRADPDVEDGLGLRAAAIVLSLSSLLSIGLVYAIARRSGLDRDVALVASTLMALSTSMLYYSRHLLPYDAGLCLVLASVWSGAARHQRWNRSLVCGVLAGLGYLTYNGYWAAAIASIGLNTWLGRRGQPGALSRFGMAAAGLLGVLVLFVGFGVAVVGPGYLSAARAFAGSVTTGDFREGWSLSWEYLWHAEHGMLLVWALGTAATVWQAYRREAAGRVAVPWLAAGLGIYLLLTVTSTELNLFVVYGRLARQLVPFVCLGAAVGLVRLAHPAFSAKLVAIGGVLILLQAAVNTAPLFAMTFPRAFVAATGMADATRTWTVLGPDDSGPPSRYVLVNAGVPWPIRSARDGPPGRTVASAPHPLMFLPYQYEGYAPRERAILRTTDLSLRLVDTVTSALGPTDQQRSP